MVIENRKRSVPAGNGVKPRGKTKPTARQPEKTGKRPATTPPRKAVKAGPKGAALLRRIAAKAEREKEALLRRRILAGGGAVLLIMALAWLMLSPDRKEAPPPPSPSRAAEAAGALTTQASAPATSPAAKPPERQLAFIQTVRLQPARPTRLDTLKAEVEVASNAPENLVFTYRWKVNDRIIEEASGETLNLSPFKKRDLITVTVTPNDGNTAGFAVDSPIIAIHGIPPSLELQAMRKARKTGEPIELQLVGNAPDAEKVTFSLEDPRVPSMAIDKESGKITWLLQAGQKGSFRFGAAVEDDNGTKTTKIFDITAE